MQNSGTLYLIPTLLGPGNPGLMLPKINLELIMSLDCFFVENFRSARRFLRASGYKKDFDQICMMLLDKHSTHQDRQMMLKELVKGRNAGIISEAGLPCIADPGSLLVNEAHKMHIHVVPLSGPSSIFMALMASGLNGQAFCFHGYLPIQKAERIKKIKELETISKKQKSTQIFMETPYRNLKLFDDIINVCQSSTKLCIAADIGLEEQYIKTNTIIGWKKIQPDIHKHPAVFLIFSES